MALEVVAGSNCLSNLYAEQIASLPHAGHIVQQQGTLQSFKSCCRLTAVAGMQHATRHHLLPSSATLRWAVF
jgi:hypothetical protein